MREGWTYKKLGEVCRINSGKSIKACEILDDQQEGFVPCYGGNGIRGYVKSVSHTGTYPIVGRVGALCGNVHLATGSFYATEHALVFTCENQNVDKRWLARYLESQSLGKYAKGVAQPVIAAGELSKLCIHIPPLYVQDAIVSELDEINSLLALKREQLQKYDKLAQSLFYEMFGDPVENEKGWEVKKYGEEFEIGSGGTPSKIKKEYWENGNIPWIGSNMCQNCVINETDGKYITQSGLEHSSAKLLSKGTVLVALVGATIGKVALLKTETSTNQNIAFIKVSDSDNYVPEFVYFHLMSMYGEFMNIGNGDFKMANLSFVRSLPILLPPLPLQQQFASCIEQIESQKQQVQAAIEKLETLLASRMQYWFD